jgi:hypothetical protein
MATSSISEIKSIHNMRARKLFALLALSFLSTFTLFSQSYLIAPDPPNNIYPITFTDAAQQVLILQFDRAVTAPGTAAGWTITVGGLPVVMAGPPAAALNFLSITLPSSISYANRNSVRVSYNNLLGTLTLIGGLHPNIVNIQAVNNYVAVAGDFFNGLYGELPPVDICAPVLSVQTQYNITITQRYRNSINFAAPLIYERWMYPSDTPKTQDYFVEVGGVGTGIYSYTAIFAAYPDNTINCTWEIQMFPYLFSTGTYQPDLFVTQNAVIITIPNYKKDNGTPVPGTGTLALNPPVDDPSTLFCVGSNITNFIFTDATAFDCQLQLNLICQIYGHEMYNMFTEHKLVQEYLMYS